MAKKISNFALFVFLTSKMTSKFKFDLIRPTQFGGAQAFWFYDFFRTVILSASNLPFKIFLTLSTPILLELCGTTKTLTNPAADLLNRVCSCFQCLSFFLNMPASQLQVHIHSNSIHRNAPAPSGARAPRWNERGSCPVPPPPLPFLEWSQPPPSLGAKEGEFRQQQTDRPRTATTKKPSLWLWWKELETTQRYWSRG